MTVYRTVMRSKGNVVIPPELREELGLKKGTLVVWREGHGRLVLTPITERRLNEIMGFLKPAPGEPSVFEASFEDGERESRREVVAPFLTGH
jgi:bifunctional DNA-binding transcriptional regulator/antitoxin component of YhaV-PrlF toxin-antitoxin module